LSLLNFEGTLHTEENWKLVNLRYVLPLPSLILKCLWYTSGSAKYYTCGVVSVQL
jgi:hypothetical protein